MPAVLEVERLSLSLGGKKILKDVSFQVPDGVHLCVVGPNGAGKTSLLKCLMRIHTRWTGSVRIMGLPVSGMTQKELARKIGYVPQAGERSFPFTASHFLLMSRYPNLSPFSPPSEQDRQAVREAFARTGTVEFAERDMGTLSGGERQKVFLAAVLAQGPGILLLDEPATFLDPFHEEKVLAILESLRRRSGTTIISVTHDINHAVLFADRVLALAGGRIVFQGSPAEFMTEDTLEGIFGRDFTLVPHPVTGQQVAVPSVPVP